MSKLTFTDGINEENFAVHPAVKAAAVLVKRAWEAGEGLADERDAIRERLEKAYNKSLRFLIKWGTEDDIKELQRAYTHARKLANQVVPVRVAYQEELKACLIENLGQQMYDWAVRYMSYSNWFKWLNTDEGAIRDAEINITKQTGLDFTTRGDVLDYWRMDVPYDGKDNLGEVI